MTPRRVLHVLHGLPPAQMGGTGLYVAALAAAQRAAGDTVAVLGPEANRPAGPEAPELLSFRGSPARRWSDTWAPAGAEAEVDRLLRAWRPDIVHLHHLAGLPFALGPRARAAGARVVLTLHDYHLACARGQLVDRTGAPCPGPAPGRCARCVGMGAAVAPAAGLLPAPLRAALQPWAAPLARWPGSTRAAPAASARLFAAQAVFRSAHARLSPSRDLAARFAAWGFPAVAPCALPLVLPIRPAPPPGDGPLRVLFASALLPTKGPDRLLRAFAALPIGAATLTLAGPPPPPGVFPGFIASLSAQARATPGVAWRGSVPPEAMEALLHAHDLLVLPSTWPENSPLVVREATAAGLRTILPAHGGAAELDALAPRLAPDAPDAALTRLLEVEIRRGRARRAPAVWPSPSDHAAWLREGPYAGSDAPGPLSEPGAPQ
jgi:glycosyltransferase involved in cell wall biosynthesis